jgi:hypothetical protein
MCVFAHVCFFTPFLETRIATIVGPFDSKRVSAAIIWLDFVVGIHTVQTKSAAAHAAALPVSDDESSMQITPSCKEPNSMPF